jgi:membrane protease YdiL (CAAX protease family)
MKAKHPILYIFILVILLLPSIFIVEALVQLALNEIYPHKLGNTEVFNSVIYLFTSMSAAFGLIAIYRKFIDKDTFFNMGFSLKGRFTDLFLGTALGTFIISLGFIIQIGLGYLEVENIQFTPTLFIGNLILMILVAVHEEVLVRGYLLNSMMGVSNKYFALALTSILFGGMHLMNPNISAISFINIVLAGLLLGTSYIHSKNLWFPIGLHFAWNFFQGPVLGYEVSGQKINSIISQNISGNTLITGGEFGFEGSIIATILMIFSIAAIHWYFEKHEALTQKITINFIENELTIKEY